MMIGYVTNSDQKNKYDIRNSCICLLLETDLHHYNVRKLEDTLFENTHNFSAFLHGQTMSDDDDDAKCNPFYH